MLFQMVDVVCIHGGHYIEGQVPLTHNVSTLELGGGVVERANIHISNVNR